MRRALLAIVTTVTGLVLLLGFKTHAIAPAASPPAAIAGTGSSSSGSSSTGSSSTGSGSATSTRTVTGDAADTRYGPVQVRVTLSGTDITAVDVIDYPSQDPRDQQINAYALPVLVQESVDADSAQIDMVSGATYTSEGYLQSLQSALDKA